MIIKRMKKRTGSARNAIVADGPNGTTVYLAKDTFDKKTLRSNCEWTEDINKAKIWRYPLHAETWLMGHKATAALTGARVINARTLEGWKEKETKR